jgi:hypothetical protein
MGRKLTEVIDSLPAAQRAAVEARAAALIAEERTRLRADVDVGLRQLDEGNASPFDEVAVEHIKRRGREKLQS